VPRLLQPHRAAAALAIVAALATGSAACRRDAAPSGTASAVSAIDPATAGTVQGRVVLSGTPPPPQRVRLDGDRTCVTFTPDGTRLIERYAVGEGGGLANVFVHVKSGAGIERSFAVPTEPVVLDQQQCWYVPRVLGVRVGQPLQVVNSDPLMHNVRANAEINQTFSQGQPVQGMRYSHTFSTAEVMVPMKCDVHAWMNAWVGVVNHPYFAVTGAEGTFTLPDLPAGTYTIEAWHEAAGTRTAEVTVTPRGTSTVALTFEVPPS
jgi:plastocyanin